MGTWTGRCEKWDHLTTTTSNHSNCSVAVALICSQTYNPLPTDLIAIYLSALQPWLSPLLKRHTHPQPVSCTDDDPRQVSRTGRTGKMSRQFILALFGQWLKITIVCIKSLLPPLWLCQPSYPPVHWLALRTSRDTTVIASLLLFFAHYWFSLLLLYPCILLPIHCTTTAH